MGSKQRINAVRAPVPNRLVQELFVLCSQRTMAPYRIEYLMQVWLTVGILTSEKAKIKWS